MTHLSDLFVDHLNEAREELACVNAFSEFVNSTIAKFRSFVAGEEDYLTVPVATDASGDVVNRLVAITQQQYQDCLAGVVDSVTVQLNDIGGSMTMSAQTILDAVEDQAAELRCQGSFFDYCLEGSNVTSSEFLSRTRALVPSVSGDVLEKYAGFISVGGSPIDAIRGFFATLCEPPQGDENTYISMVNVDDYTGNPWVSAMTTAGKGYLNIMKTVVLLKVNIYVGLWRLAKKAKKAVKWAAGKLFGQLLTAYEKSSDASNGIMDMPFIQVYWSTLSELSNLFTTLQTNASYLYALDDYAHQRETYLNSAMMNIVMDSITNLTRQWYNHGTYDSVTEIIVPSKPFPMSIRIGKDEDGRGCLSMYFVSDYGSWSKYTDVTVQQQMITSFVGAAMNISAIVPLGVGKQIRGGTGSQLMSNYLWQFTDYLQASATANSWISNQKLLNKSLSSIYGDYANNNQVVAFLCSTLLYACLMSKGFVSSLAEDATDVTDSMLQDYLTHNAGYNDYDPEELEPIDDYGSSFNTSVADSSVFKPYAKYKLLPITIHYQTTAEQADEILRVVAGVAFAVVVAVIAAKFIKWRVTRQAQTTLAHGNTDRLAWAASENPTSENILAFNKAFEKSRRMDVVNGLLGLSSDSSGSGVLPYAIKGITQGVAHLSKNTQEETGQVSSTLGTPPSGATIASMASSTVDKSNKILNRLGNDLN